MRDIDIMNFKRFGRHTDESSGNIRFISTRLSVTSLHNSPKIYFMTNANAEQVKKALETIDNLLLGTEVSEYKEVLHELILSYLLNNDLNFDQRDRFIVVYVQLKEFLTKLGAI